LIQEAKKLHLITKKYGVPLIINDRVDVAVAVGAEGAHIGQDDMDIESARTLLSHLPNPIIGVSASNLEEALLAAKGKATYLGLGTVFATSTYINLSSVHR
jgi:thiamine-phosphate diphosphorylase/hydroxyethylthiazole kinase